MRRNAEVDRNHPPEFDAKKWVRPLSKINDVDCVWISGLNWKLHIPVDIAVIMRPGSFKAIKWSGTFHHARSLIRKRQYFSINSATVIAPSPRGNVCPTLPLARAAAQPSLPPPALGHLSKTANAAEQAPMEPGGLSSRPDGPFPQIHLRLLAP